MANTRQPAPRRRPPFLRASAFAAAAVALAAIAPASVTAASPAVSPKATQHRILTARQTLSATRVSMTTAIATADSHATGKALRAELETNPTHPRFVIEVLSASRLETVVVDGLTGEVVSSASVRATAGTRR